MSWLTTRSDRGYGLSKTGSHSATGRIQSRQAGDVYAAPSNRPGRGPRGPARPGCGVRPTVGSRGKCHGSALAASVRAASRRWRGIATSNGGRAGMPADAGRRATPAGRRPAPFASWYEMTGSATAKDRPLSRPRRRKRGRGSVRWLMADCCHNCCHSCCHRARISAAMSTGLRVNARRNMQKKCMESIAESRMRERG
jgi:hypothetical protein